jgi:ElaB/YqjD/DUF883 family membrane-anchored ribosome-binding protein
VSKPLVYLAGPISGETVKSAHDWRYDMTRRLARRNIIGITPQRGQSVNFDRFPLHGNDPCFSTQRAIVGKNFLDVKRCDFILAYFPKPPEVAELDAILERMGNLANVVEQMVGPLDDDGKAIADDVEALRRIARRGIQRTLGTVGEVSWSKVLQKPCAIVTDDPFIQEHPFTATQCDWMLPSLDEAERLIVGLFGDYAR